MSEAEKISLGVVVERRETGNAWQPHAWRALTVIPGIDSPERKLLQEGDGWAQYLAGTLDLVLYPKETEGYQLNLSQPEPSIYVVVNPDEGDELGVVPFLVTVCPYEAESYTESDADDVIVDRVSMPPEIHAWVQAFIDTHYVVQPFKKRKQKPHHPQKGDSHWDLAKRGGPR